MLAILTCGFCKAYSKALPTSADDFASLTKLGQSKQYVYHGGEVTAIRPLSSAVEDLTGRNQGKVIGGGGPKQCGWGSMGQHGSDV